MKLTLATYQGGCFQQLSKTNSCANQRPACVDDYYCRIPKSNWHGGENVMDVDAERNPIFVLVVLDDLSTL